MSIISLIVPGLALNTATEVACRYGIAERVLRRWKQEFAAAPAFVSVKITDAPAEERTP
jgi:hypothetical protein